MIKGSYRPVCPEGGYYGSYRPAKTIQLYEVLKLKKEKRKPGNEARILLLCLILHDFLAQLG